MGAVFIAGTGTDIGKTYLTCALVRYLQAQQQPIHAIKPVISGYDAANPEASDTYRIAQALSLPWSDTTANALSPWRFTAPLSPHLAARRDGAELRDEALLAFCRTQIAQHPRLLIEGAGGLLSPLNDTMLNIDLAAHLSLPVILVTGSYLGSIGHTLSAMECLQHRGLTLLAIVVSAHNRNAEAALKDTTESLQHFSTLTCPILSLPYEAHNASLAPIVHAIATRL